MPRIPPCLDLCAYVSLLYFTKNLVIFQVTVRLRLLQEETVFLLTTLLTPNVWVLQNKRLSTETNRMFYNLI